MVRGAADTALRDPHGFRVQIAGLNRYTQIAFSDECSKFNRRVTSPASQLKHTQLSRWGLVCKRLNLRKKLWHAATNSISPTQTLEGSVMLCWIKPRLIYNFGPPITVHRGPAQRHVPSLLFDQPK